MRCGPFTIGEAVIQPGQRQTVDLPIARLYTHTAMDMPVHVIHGKKEGPTLFVSAAIHGDEINGVEIVRRLLKLKLTNNIRGTLIAIPIVNVYGFINRSRYLPDRRDLNRSFPGNNKGSLASHLAKVFMTEVVRKCSHGIDIHTGSNHRTNLPQIRVTLGNSETEQLAQAFGAPVILDSRLRDNSLRATVTDLGIPMLLYEGGEGLRFNESAIRVGLKGILAVMREIGMLPKKGTKTVKRESVV
ncbi:MAG: succinylglutamate desuccinylase/aspartoacylase family protein, partial [Desulfobulbaceae bacterium]|nr:succinylglutamate desuccinylase/aspartoacylase family protein [Desulfobulbaceae bacterium]